MGAVSHAFDNGHTCFHFADLIVQWANQMCYLLVPIAVGDYF